jgi:gliding motility-associated-like protein
VPTPLIVASTFGPHGRKVISSNARSLPQPPGAPLAAATTNYSYYSADCPNDGSYTVTNSTSGCFNDTWLTVTQDHTGDANGYFMLVNASFDTGDFFVDKISGLCSNTTFEFSAWVLNVVRSSACGFNSIKPNLTFKIEKTDGTLLQSYNTGDIAVAGFASWKQYGFFFVTPPGISDVIVRITNNAPGGCGNDLALDDITFRPCGPKVDATISGVGTVKSFCEDSVTKLTFTSSVSPGYTNPSFLWQQSNNGIDWTDIANANSTTYSTQFFSAGNFFYRLAVAEAGNIATNNCRVASNILKVNVNKKPIPNATTNGPGCDGKDLILSASDGLQYNWTGPNNFSASTQTVTLANLAFGDSGKYFVTVTTDSGCTNTDSVIVAVNPTPVAFARNDTAICEGSNVMLNGGGNGSYNWNPVTGLSSSNMANPVASPLDSTQYILTVTNQFGCFDEDTVNINVFKAPKADAGADKVILQYQSVQLNGNVSGTNISYYWSPNIYINNINSLQPVVSPLRDTTYILHAVSNVGCGSAIDFVFVKVYPKVIVPNAFSPNHDGINDKWQLPELISYPNAEVFVFNRYGQIVFHSVNYKKPWNGSLNGSPLPFGTYYYLIDLKTSLLPKLSGWLEILR